MYQMVTKTEVFPEENWMVLLGWSGLQIQFLKVPMTLPNVAPLVLVTIMFFSITRSSNIFEEEQGDAPGILANIIPLIK